MSAPFKKLKLVSEEELLRLQERQLKQYDPNLRVLAKAHSQITDLLNPRQDSTLTANERLRLLDMLRNRFREIKNVTMSAAPAKVSTMIPTPEKPQPEPAEEDDEIEMADASEAVAAPAEAEAEEFKSPIGEAPVPFTFGVAARPDLRLKSTILSAIPSKSRKDAKDLLNMVVSHPDVLSYNPRMEAVVRGQTIPDSNFISLYKSAFSTHDVNKAMPGYRTFHKALKSIRDAPSSITRQSTPPGHKPSILRVYNA